MQGWQLHRIETRKKIHIRYRITEFEKDLQFLRLFLFCHYFCWFLLFRLKLYFGPKTGNVLAFVASQSQYVIKINLARAELQFTLF